MTTRKLSDGASVGDVISHAGELQDGAPMAAVLTVPGFGILSASCAAATLTMNVADELD